MKRLTLLLTLFHLSTFAAFQQTTPAIISPVRNVSGNALAAVASNPTGASIAVWQTTTLNLSPPRNVLIEAATTTTATASWSAVQAIGFGLNPEVAINDSGNGVAVWVDNYQIKAAQYDTATNRWTTETLLSTNSDRGTNTLPQVGISNSGRAFAVWVFTNAFGYSVIRTSELTGGVWSTLPTNLSRINNRPAANFPDISMDNNNRAVVTWQNSFPSQGITIIESTILF